ncbi:molecular chaperone [Yersinia entomophaga]|uniref:fimbrial biogenesis chaperone n=1 Tax=Yersinia entomophaga TaxID=935293 RepID=UPI0007E3349F|nr:molecular chaperone [Yersinia entomophaga]
MKKINTLAKKCYKPFILLILTGFSFNIFATNNVLIWPIDPVIPADQKSSSLWVENKGDQATMMQVRILGWQQTAGKEGYLNQQNVIASPPIIRIEAGKKQLIRLIKQVNPTAGQEQAYRILIDEIPTPTLSAKAQEGAGVNFQMRYSIPLFVYGDGLDYGNVAADKNTHQPQLSWQLVELQGKKMLEVTNSGAIHARLSDVKLQQGGQNHQVAEGLLGYVLANSSQRWPVSVSSASSLTMQVNNQKNVKLSMK